jgi:hypothetical protein
MSQAPLLACAASAPLKVCDPFRDNTTAVRQFCRPASSPAADPRSTLFSCLAPRHCPTDPHQRVGATLATPFDTREIDDTAETEVKGVTGVVVKDGRPEWGNSLPD